jgi:alanine-synthesizing transaminase
MFSSRTNWPLAPNRLAEAVDERRRRNLPLIDLTESNPTRAGFAFASEDVLAALDDPRSLTYEPDPRGLQTAREAVAAYYAELGVGVDPQQIFLTTSTSEAYSFLFRLLADAGDRVLVPRPSYPLFEYLAGLDDIEVVTYPLVYDDEWRIDLERLQSAMAGPCSEAGGAPTGTARAILVVHPNNPTGSFVSRTELAALACLCHQREMALIADEVFADYAFRVEGKARSAKERVVSFADVADVLTFTLSGLSKISALPQMKLAWIVVSGPADLRRTALERLEIIADTYLSVSAPLANALPKWLDRRRAVQSEIMERVERNLRCLDDQLASGSPVSRLAAEGGWYTILRVPSTRTDEDGALELVRSDGVLVHPGHFYDFPSEGYLVVSLLPRPEVFAAGVRRVCARASRNS